MQAGCCKALGVFLALQFLSSAASSPLDCPDVPVISNGSYFVLRDSSTGEGPIVRYACEEGFFLEGDQDLTCVLKNGSFQWIPDPPMCQEELDCPNLGTLKHGYIEHDGCCAPGDVVEFFCDEDFELEGAASATCQYNGFWSEPKPTCRSIFCPDPGVSAKGNKLAVLANEVYEGRCCPRETLMVFECHEGYDLIGEQILRCGADSLWSSPRPLCKPAIACEGFLVDHGTVSGAKSEGDYYGLGDDVFVSCDDGYRVEGSDILFCEENGEWDADPPQCVAYNCTRRDFGPHVVVPEFRATNATSFSVGTTVYFKCEEGYVLDGPSSTTCKSGGWFGRPPKCHLIQCGALVAPDNGWMTGSSTAVGSTVSFHCFQGYRLLGSPERQCFSDGQWGGDVARCVSEASISEKSFCLDPGAPDNGIKLENNYKVGNNVSFACRPGFQLRGEQSIRCNYDGKWSAPPPLCIGRFYFDKPRSVEESLRNQLTRLAEESAKLNKNDEQLERSINVNERGVRHIVYFAFDASASIGLNNLKTGIGLAKAITRKINVTDDGHRVGAVRFNNTAKLMLSPMNVKSTDAALLALDAVATEKTAGGTAIREAVKAITTSLEIVDRHLKKDGFKLKFSIFFITDGKANLGGSPAKDVENLRKRHYADIYCIGLTGSPDHSALKQLATDTDHVFILRNYAVMQWLADHLTNGTTDYSVCGRSSKHTAETGLEIPDDSPQARIYGDYSVCGRSSKHTAETGLEIPDDSPQARIYGGEQAVDSWPWMVEMRAAADEEFFCGATIISSQWLLTAAHCLFVRQGDGYRKKSVNEFKLRLGLTDRKNTSHEQEVFVEEIIRHDGYIEATKQNDIALLRLNQTITFNEFARPICLPPSYDDTRACRTPAAPIPPVVGPRIT
ncbi:complement factor B [Ixodes scapularis]